MKTFNQLTPLQQEEAILRAEVIVRDALVVVESDIPIQPEHIRGYAEAAALDAFYTQSGDLIFDGVA